MAVMVSPTIGEIRLGNEIGRRDHSHRVIWQACQDCGKERWVSLRKGLPESLRCNTCSAFGRHQGNAGKFKGGNRVSSDGYTLIRMTPDDFFFPMAKKSDCYLLEHRLVMAKHLQRLLHPWEIIHHKNGNKTDNRIENLQLVSDDRHKQITILENRIHFLEKRVTLLEVELELVKGGIK